MSRYSNEAKKKVTIEINYERPPFIFPDISGEQGNPIEYFKLATAQLKKFGFYRESKELEQLGPNLYKRQFNNALPYEEHFNAIARFLDFTHSQVESEDDDYIYLKIKKGSEGTEQPRVFAQQSLTQIKELIEEGHDFSLTNCYNRNHLHYLKDFNAINLLIEFNEQHDWFSLFELDIFNSTILHGERTMPVFAYLLSKMYEGSPELTKTYLYGTNVFGHNAFGEFLKECDIMFSPKSPLPSMEKISEIGQVLQIVGKIDPEKRNQFIGMFDIVEKQNPAFKKADIKPIILKSILEADMATKEEIKSKRMKL